MVVIILVRSLELGVDSPGLRPPPHGGGRTAVELPGVDTPG